MHALHYAPRHINEMDNKKLKLGLFSLMHNNVFEICLITETDRTCQIPLHMLVNNPSGMINKTS